MEVFLGAHGAALSVGCTPLENRKGGQFWGRVLGLSTLGAFARARFLGRGLARSAFCCILPRFLAVGRVFLAVQGGLLGLCLKRGQVT